jgi:RelE toxin of RelE / RelB toxin-antitoxin system
VRLLFIESRNFTEWVGRFLDAESYAELQRLLLDDPSHGVVMPGCGGLRKIRVSDPTRHRGKRGGARVIYFHVPEANWLFFLDGYSKDEKEDLSPQEKKDLSRLADNFRHQAISATQRSR